MLNKLKNIINGATWFLRSGVVPPNDEKNIVLKNTNHMTSRKFAMTLIAVAIVAFMYFASVIMLFFFPADPHVSALVSMYKDMIVAIATIVGTLVGIQGLVDWKYNGNSNVSQKTENTKNESYIEEYLSGPKENDYTLDIEFASNEDKNEKEL